MELGDVGCLMILSLVIGYVLRAKTNPSYPLFNVLVQILRKEDRAGLCGPSFPPSLEIKMKKMIHQEIRHIDWSIKKTSFKAKCHKIGIFLEVTVGVATYILRYLLASDKSFDNEVSKEEPAFYEFHATVTFAILMICCFLFLWSVQEVITQKSHMGHLRAIQQWEMKEELAEPLHNEQHAIEA